MPENKTQEQNFEQIMQNLNKILELLEKGDLSLESSMQAYESGVGLVRKAENKLRAMEGRMEQIMADGEIKDLSPKKMGL